MDPGVPRDDGVAVLHDLRGGSRPVLGPRPYALGPDRKGFTLLEVLVALFLLSIALVALIRAAGLEARALAHERDATLAQWVASNALAEVRLRQQLPTGREEGREELGGRRWRWRLELTATDSPKIVRADVSVFPDEESDVAADAASARLQGFIER